MYGVRIIVDDKIDIKIFETPSLAQERFRQGWAQAYDGEFDSIALFLVKNANDVRDAAEAIRFGEKERIELLDIQESRDKIFAKLTQKIRIEL